MFSSDSEDDFEVVDVMKDDVVEEEVIALDGDDSGGTVGEKVNEKEKCNFVRYESQNNSHNGWTKKHKRKCTKKAWKRQRPNHKNRILYAEKKRMLRQSFDALQRKMNVLAKVLELKVNKSIEKYTLDVNNAFQTYLSLSCSVHRKKVRSECECIGHRHDGKKGCNFHEIFSAIHEN